MNLSQPSNNVTARQVGQAVKDAIAASDHNVLKLIKISVDESEIERDRWDWIVPVGIEGSDVSIKSFELHQALEEIQGTAAERIGESVFLQIAY